MHAAALVEEAFGDDGRLAGDGSEHGAPGDDVGDQLLGSAGTDSALFHKPCGGRGHLWLCGRDISGRNVWSARGYLFAELADAIA